MSRQNQERSSSWSPFVFASIGVMLAGLFLLAYPTVMSRINSANQEDDIEAYQDALERVGAGNISGIREAANKYNMQLTSMGIVTAVSEFDEEAYQKQLDPAETGVMGYLTVPALKVKVPIYHGSSDEIMRMGAGHIEGTSLPVGGPSTHSAVTAHRGEPGSSYFEELDKLVEGDTFSVDVLGETLTYEVDKISVVEPNDIRALAVVKGEDLFTLVTCTPYAVNTHRLLVRGHRVSE